MIQMRWLTTNYEKPKLQYRQIIDKTVRGQPVGPFGKPIEYHTPWGQVPPITQNWQWTDWKDVPYVEENNEPAI